MADNKEIEIKISTDTSDAEKGFKDVSKQADSMSKKIEKSADKVEKSFDDVEKTLKDVQKTMNTTFKNTNFNNFANSMKNAMQQVQRQVQTTANTIKSQLQKALNIQGNIDIKTNTTTDASSGSSSMMGNMMGELAGSSMSGSAIGSQIAKQLSLMRDSVVDAKKEIDKIDLFQNLTDDAKEDMASVIKSVTDFGYTVSDIFGDGRLKFHSIDSSKYTNMIKFMIDMTKELEDTIDEVTSPKDFEEFALQLITLLAQISEYTSETNQGFRKLKEEMEGVFFTRIDATNFETSFKTSIKILEQFESELNNTKLALDRLQFISNLHIDVESIKYLTQEYEKLGNNESIEEMAYELASISDKAKELGMSFNYIDDMFNKYIQATADGKVATKELNNEVINVAKKFIQSGNSAQLQVQKMRELGQATGTLQKALIKAKYGFKEFEASLPAIFDNLTKKAKGCFDSIIKKTKEWSKTHLNASKKIKSANKGITNSFKSLLSTMLPFASVYGIFQGLKTSITSYVDSLANSTKFATAFGNETKEMVEWVEELNSKVTMAKSDIMDFSSNLYRMGRNMGVASEDAKNMAQQMTELGADLLAYTNDANSIEALAGALRGEYDSLQNYGYALSASAVEARALALGLDTASESALMFARQSLILEQSADIMGYASSHAQTLGGQMAMLRKNFQALGSSIGACFAGLLQVVLPVLNAIVSAVTQAFNKIASVINAIFGLFGVKVGGGSTGGGGAIGSAIGGITDSLGGGLGDAAGGAGDVADSLGSAADSAAAIQKSLMGIDEINNLSTPDNSSSGGSGGGSGGSGGGGLGGGLGDFMNPNVVEETTSFVDIVEEDLERLKRLFRDFLAGFNSTFDPSAFEEIKQHLINIKNHLLDIVNDPLVQDSFNMMTRQWAMTLGAFVGTLAQIGTQITLGLVGGIDQSLSENKEHIKQKLVEIFDVKSEIAIEFRKGLYGISEIAKSFGSEEAKTMVANIVTGITNASLEFILLGNKIGRDLIHSIAQPIYDNQDEIREAFETTFGFVGDTIGVIMDNIEIILSKFNTFYDTYIKPFIDSWVEGWSEIFGTLLEGYNTYMKPTFDKIVGHLKNFFETYIQPTVSKILEALGKLFSALKDYWENTLQPLINWIAQYIFPVIAPIIDMVVRVVLDGIGAMITIIGDIIVWIIDFVTECVQMSANVGKAFGILKDLVVEHCTRLWNKAKEIWESLGGDIKTVVQNLKQMAIDKFIEIKNKVIEKCQELKQKAKEKWEEIKTSIMEKITQFKEDAIEKVKETKEDIIEKFNELIQPIKDVWDGIWGHIEPIIEKLKNAFDFEWKLPEIKLPKVNISKKVGLFGLEYPSFDVKNLRPYMETYNVKPTKIGGSVFQLIQFNSIQKNNKNWLSKFNLKHIYNSVKRKH